MTCVDPEWAFFVGKVLGFTVGMSVTYLIIKGYS